jgi:hypothetical protein
MTALTGLFVQSIDPRLGDLAAIDTDVETQRCFDQVAFSLAICRPAI